MNDRDASLLFGVFAVQFKKVTPQQLHGVAQAWTSDPSRDLSQMLVDAGFINEEDRIRIHALVEEAHEAHGGDSAAALESFGGQHIVELTYHGSVSDSQDRLSTVQMPEGSIPGVPIGSIDAVDETPGRYTNSSEYARGGIGRVLLVHDQHLGREIAMKELLPFASTIDDSMKLENESPVQRSMSLVTRFLQEARVTGQLEHPSIVPVYELGRRRDGTLYYTMKLVRGRTLATAIRESKTLEDRLALLAHFVDLCQAIAYSHSRRVIHRDIKPSNVMVGKFGETVVLDWGLAKVHDKKDEHAEQIQETLKSLRLPGGKPLDTRTGQVLGTPAYMPPEQAAGQIDRVDERSDVYSLGAVLYTLLSGKYPYEGDNAGDILNKVLVGPPDSVKAAEPNVPTELAAICERAMSRDAAKRYANAAELAKDVIRFQTGALVQAYDYKFSEHLRRFVKRNQPVLATAAIFAAALIGFGVYSYVQVTYERNEAVLARDAEQEQRILATEARDAEAEQRKRAQALLYQADLRLAQNQIDSKRFDLAAAALEAAPAELRGWEWQHLHDVCQQDIFTFNGHKRPINAMELSPDGKYVVSGDEAGTVFVIDAANGEVVHAFPSLDDSVRDVAFDPSGTRVLAATSGGSVETPDGSVTIWDVKSGNRLVHFDAEGRGALLMARYSPDGKLIATTGFRTGVDIWNANDGKQLHSFSLPNENVGHLDFNPAEPQLAAATSDGTVKVWDVTGNEYGEIASLQASVGSVNALEYSPDGKWLAAGGDSGELAIWDATYKEPTQLKPRGTGVQCIAFSPDGSSLSAGLLDGSVYLNTLPVGEGTFLRGHTDGVGDIEFSPDGSTLATASYDDTIRLWDVATGQQLHEYDGHSSQAVRVHFTPDSSRILSGSYDATIKAWQVSPNPLAPVMALQEHEGGFGGIEFSPSGDRVLTYSGVDNPPYTISIWDAKTDQQLATIDRPSAGEIYHASWSHDGHHILAAYSNGSASIWDAITGGEAHELAGHSMPLSGAVFSPNDTQVVTVSRDKTAALWRADDGSQLHVLRGHTGAIYGVTFSSDGKKVATYSYDKTIRVWDCETGNATAVLEGHDARITDVCFLRDGKRLVSSAGDKLIIVWDIESGKPLRRLEGHSETVFDVAISPDERSLASVSSDATLRIWDLATGNQLQKCDGHSGTVLSVAYSPDGNRIVSGGEDQTVRVWDTNTGLELAVFRDFAHSVRRVCFSPDGDSLASQSERFAIFRRAH